MKYVFKCVTPQHALAANMNALENGNDLLFKKVAGKVEVNRRERLVKSQNTSLPSSHEL